METRAHYILIGSFALAVMAGAALFVLWLGRIEREFDFYDVVFNESVAGLSVAGDVRFRGIKVGEVRELTLDENDLDRVVARIRVVEDTPIKEDTIAQLQLQGVTGLLYIELSGGAPGVPRLRPRLGEPVPQITAQPSEVTQIIESGGDIVTQIGLLLSEENIDNISAIIENISTVTNAFAEQNGAIESAIEDLSAASESLAASGEDFQTLVASLSSASERLDTLLAGDAAVAIKDLGEAAEAVREFATTADELVKNNEAALEAFTAHSLPQTTLAIAEARRLIRSLEGVTAALESDPTRFLNGGHFPEVEVAE